jgi:hypothetical protein
LKSIYLLQPTVIVHPSTSGGVTYQQPAAAPNGNANNLNLYSIQLQYPYQPSANQNSLFIRYPTTTTTSTATTTYRVSNPTLAPFYVLQQNVLQSQAGAIQSALLAAEPKTAPAEPVQAQPEALAPEARTFSGEEQPPFVEDDRGLIPPGFKVYDAVPVEPVY